MIQEAAEVSTTVKDILTIVAPLVAGAIGGLIGYFSSKRGNTATARKTENDIFIESQDKILELVEQLRKVYADVIKLEQVQARYALLRQKVKLLVVETVQALQDVAVDGKLIKKLKDLQDEIEKDTI